MTIPMRANIRRQDRPRHVGEAARKERRGRFHDVMLRLEPGDEMRFLFAADFAEANRGLHPVLLAVHGLCHGGGLRNVGIISGIEQIVIPAQPPQQPVEQRKAFAIAVQDGGLCQFNEFSGHVEGAARCFKWRINRRLERGGFI